MVKYNVYGVFDRRNLEKNPSYLSEEEFVITLSVEVRTVKLYFKSWNHLSVVGV